MKRPETASMDLKTSYILVSVVILYLVPFSEASDHDQNMQCALPRATIEEINAILKVKAETIHAIVATKAEEIDAIIQEIGTTVVTAVDKQLCRYRVKDCQEGLGMENGQITDAQIMASSEYHAAINARLNRIKVSATIKGGWSAKKNDANQWIQADLGGLKWVTGVKTQGRQDWYQWVTKFKVQYSSDGSSWNDVQNGEIFDGNTDKNTIVSVQFYAPVKATLVRIIPTEWHEHISLRFEVLGCEASTDILDNGQSCPTQVEPRDCYDVQQAGNTQSGIYNIQPDNVDEPFHVHCDMETDGGGWTVFQRRVDGLVDFYRDWASYKQGFGKIGSDFWLGNDKIFTITNQGSYELRVDMVDENGNSLYAHYDNFGIGDESTKYKLAVSGYSGDAGEALDYHDGMAFSTKDQENDLSPSNCAIDYKAAWWYNECFHSSLNGPFAPEWHGMRWINTYLKRTEMKMRPVN